MSIEGQSFHPSEQVAPWKLLKLANEYRSAADILLPTGRRRKPLSRAPYRLVAIQAIELYLNAFMLHCGYPPGKLRALQHNLAPRALFARTNGLDLTKGTFEHLFELAASREYLVSRYDPEPGFTLSNPNRLEATLKEVAEKVAAATRRAGTAS